ncbi:MAG: lytic transglycosylase domain-containing protein [Proteobacteria bacterium]|nr:lytic transglycosylase domain-containing protein [Pseudomonadota bacterium]
MAAIAVAVFVVVGPFGLLEVRADILTPGDAKALKAGLEFVEKEKFAQARSMDSKIKNPIASSILTWVRLSQPDPTASFEEIGRFMARHPGWPQQGKLQRRAEEAITRETPGAEVLDWFAKRKPLSGDGKARMGEALVAAGRTDEGLALIRDAWINGNFTKRRELYFYKRNRRYLSRGDNLKRLDRLLWEGRYWPSRRMMWKVPPEYRELATARMFLRHRRGNVDTAIAKVPDKLKNDPGLIYERLRWRRHKGKFQEALEILNQPPDDLVYPDRWWVERAFVARQMLQKGNITDAYRLAKNHGVKDGASFAEAEWLSGWIALQFLKDAQTARRHFETMYNAVKYPVSQSRGAYWMARAFEALGNDNKAAIWHRLAANHPTTYYGQLSIASLHPGAGLEFDSSPDPGKQETASFEADDLVAAVRILGQIDEADRIRPFILHLDSIAKTSGWRLLTAELAMAQKRPDLSVLIAKRAARDGLSFPDNAFPSLIPPPMNARTSSPPVETSLILAIIRQESAFHIKARSHANAQGLMQLMPRTALKVAKRLKIPFSRRRLTTDGIYNLSLGQAYLSGLLETFKGSYVLALAAYNAGPKRARQWLRRNGDLRNKDVDSIDWVELIPFNETRNYVQRVLENLQVYRHRLAKTEVALRLKNDLHQ